MIARCTNPNNVMFYLYGGRGITVCERWRTFDNFLADMGPRPDGLTLDRIDPEGHYEPGNCRWATPKEQQENRRCARLITYNGETKTLAEWARSRDLSFLCLWNRLERGWPLDRALDRPLVYRRKPRTTEAPSSPLPSEAWEQESSSEERQ